MKIPSARRMAVAVTAFGTLLASLSACDTDAPRPARTGGVQGPRGPAAQRPAVRALPPADPTRIPGIGNRMQRQIPDDSGQVLAVYGEGRNSPDSTAVLYTKDGPEWRPVARWAAHNGRNGWTGDHHSGDRRSPMGVFGLSDAGGVLDDPGSMLPYDQNEKAYAPTVDDAAYEHVFDYVIAIDYNRLPGTPPHDPTRPEGDDKGGGIWLHLDHGGGTDGCVSLPEEAMEFLLRTLDPDRHPVTVMGDRTALSA